MVFIYWEGRDSMVFPFTTYEAYETAVDELPLYKEVAYDIETNSLQRKAGRIYFVYKDDAIKIWIYKALKVKRYAYTAYTHNYGNEIENVVGKTTDKGIFESEMERYITECLIVNPYIQELNNFVFTHGEYTRVRFDVTTIYGRFTYESEVYNE